MPAKRVARKKGSVPMSKRKRAQQRKRLGFVPKATGNVAHGPNMGFTISCRSHEIHTDKRKQADKRACRGRVNYDG